MLYVSYDKERLALYVQFDKAETYMYSGVSEDVAKGMEFASAFGVSVGQYFQKYIKHFPSVRVV